MVFLALTNSVQFLYKCSDFYDPARRGILWNDPDRRSRCTYKEIGPNSSGPESHAQTLQEHRSGSVLLRIGEHSSTCQTEVIDAYINHEVESFPSTTRQSLA